MCIRTPKLLLLLLLLLMLLILIKLCLLLWWWCVNVSMDLLDWDLVIHSGDVDGVRVVAGGVGAVVIAALGA